MTTRVRRFEAQADEKTRLIQDIRRYLPYVAIGHPDLAREIERAMVLVESEKPDFVPSVFAEDQTRLAVGVEVEIPPYLDGRKRYGLIVQMGDEDTRPDCVLVYQGPESEYPAWWAIEAVRPLAVEKQT